MNENHVIETLNEFLQGQYMGIHAYEHLIARLEDDQVKQQFQMIQQNHKEHAMRVAERIQNLGGTPVDDEGFIGSIQGFMSQLTLPESTEDIIESAIKGESDYGIGMSEKIVRGDLDPESYQLIEQIFDEDRKHVEFLRNLLH